MILMVTKMAESTSKFWRRHDMNHAVKSALLFLFAVVVLIPGVLRAQQAAIEVDNAPTVVGVLVGAAPDYLGSKDYKGVIAPFLKYTLPGSYQYLLLRGTELSFNLINHPSFRFGPVVNYRPERGSVENSQVDRMETIDAALEGGAFAGFECIDKSNPRRRFLAHADVDRGHERRVQWLARHGPRQGMAAYRQGMGHRLDPQRYLW